MRLCLATECKALTLLSMKSELLSPLSALIGALIGGLFTFFVLRLQNSKNEIDKF